MLFCSNICTITLYLSMLVCLSDLLVLGFNFINKIYSYMLTLKYYHNELFDIKVLFILILGLIKVKVKRKPQVIW